MSTVEAPAKQKLSKTVTFSLISAISTILASAGVVMWAIIAQPPGDTIGKAFLTIFLISIFTFSLIAETRIEHSASYITPGRIFALVLIIASGLYLTWNQVYPEAWRDLYEGDLGAWLGVIILMQGVAATLILLLPRMTRNMQQSLVRYTFNAGVLLVILVAGLISFAWTTWDLEWTDDFWRIVLAISVLAAVMFLIPLVISMILAPKRPKPTYAQYQPVQTNPAPAVASWDEIVARGTSGEQETPPTTPTN